MISLYCSETLDGVSAAAIIWRHSTLSKLPVHFGGFLHQDQLTEELEDITKDTGRLLFFLDISFTPEHLIILEKIAKNNKIVYWNTADDSSVVPPAKLTDQTPDKCSAALARQRFLPNDNIAMQLADFAHQVKFWQITDERAGKLSDLIAANYDTIPLIEALAKGSFWNQQFEEFHKEYSQKKVTAYEELMRSIKIKGYLNYRFGFAISPGILTTADACSKILNSHAGVDVAIALYKDGRVAFRRRDNVDINVKDLAELFNGGGRPYAAGARLNTTVTKDNTEDILFHLDQAFKNFFVHNT